MLYCLMKLITLSVVIAFPAIIYPSGNGSEDQDWKARVR